MTTEPPTAPPPPSMDEPRERATRWLGGWEILRELDAGGMGQVVIARRRGPEGFERLAAVKTLRAELRGSEPLRRMFLDEAQLLARLSHPAIAQIYDFGEHDGALYLVMELVAGVNLREVEALRPPPAVSARLIAAACRGLHAAHELTDLHGQPLGVVHRDVSPDNLMLTFEGQVKVLDFGIALMRGRSAPVTELGLIKGKPPYLSPEQVKNQPLDRRTDVWSAAVVLHELLTGAPLFEGDSVYAIARVIAEAPLMAPSHLAGPLPPGLDEVVLRALSREREDRFPTALAFAEALEATATGGEELAGFAARALGPAKIAHRDAMRRVLEGSSIVRPRPRASGVVTALAGKLDEAGPEAAARPPPEVAAHPAPEAAPLAFAPLAFAPTSAALRPEASDLDAAGASEARPGRRRGAALLAFLAALLAVVAWRVAVRERGDRTTPAVAAAPLIDARPAPADAAVAIAAGPVDAAAPVVTAPSPLAPPEPVGDGGHRRRPRPAATPPATPIAAPPSPQVSPPAPAATGSGTVTIAARPFATIKIDGTVLTTTPVFNHPLAAGSHEVVLLDPASGAERLRRTIRITAGGHESVVLDR